MKTATIDPSGKVTGKLTDGKQYESRIPTALTDDTLAADLSEHDVAVTGTAKSTSLWGVVVLLLPFVLLLGLFFWISRRATKQMAGGLMGIGASKAKVYDQQRPTTRFADVAGYEGAKREISEVVDFLKHPERYRGRGRGRAARRADGRTARYRQDAPGAGRGGRGRRAVLRDHGFELRRDVRRRGRRAGARPLRRGAQGRARRSSSSTRSTRSASAAAARSSRTTSASRR